MRILSEVSNVTLRAEDRVVRSELLVSDNMLNGFIELLLVTLVPTFILQMSRKIATPSTKTSTATPFAFGSKVERGERVERLLRRKMTNDFIRNVRFDALEWVSVCTCSGRS